MPIRLWQISLMPIGWCNKVAKILLGKPVADAIYADIDSRVNKMCEKGISPCLCLVRIGSDPASQSYENSLVKKAEEHGIVVKRFDYEELTQPQFEDLINKINDDDSIHGCLVFQPLPDFLDARVLQSSLDSGKDIDCITDTNSAKIYSNSDCVFVPATAQSCLEILDYYGFDVTGKNVVIAGRSLVVGRPLSMLLLHRHATVTITHSKTENLEKTMKDADIVVLATGRAKAFTPEFFSEGQVVIDVATNVGADGKLTGDADFESVEPIVGAITPVPRGVGSVTTSVMLKFVCCAAERCV